MKYLQKLVFAFIVILIGFNTHAQLTYVPDDGFEQRLIDMGLDNVLDDYVSTSAIDTVISLNFDTYWISSIEGIQDFTSLEKLKGDFNLPNQTLSLTGLTTLKYLNISYSQFDSISLNSCILLDTLIVNNIYSNSSFDLDISNLTNLKYLDLSNSYITTIDLNNQVNLETLICSQSDLLNLNVQSNINLVNLTIESNQITTLGLTNNINLESLNISSNSVTTLDLTNCVSLKKLTCNVSSLTGINLLNNSLLEEIFIDINNYHVDLNGNQNLKKLTYYGVTDSINVSALDQLKELRIYCDLNYLTPINNDSLKLIHILNTSLDSIFIQSESLNSLDIQNNSLLNTLQLENTINLISINIQQNNINELDLSGCYTLASFQINDEPNLNYLNLKNGNNDTWLAYGIMPVQNCPILQYVCIDDINDLLLTNIISIGVNHPVYYTEYCTLNPANSFILRGKINMDLQNNGCNSQTPPEQNILILAEEINSGMTVGTFSNQDGDYYFNLDSGTYFINAIINNLPLWSANYSNTNISLNQQNPIDTINTCISPSTEVNDLSTFVSNVNVANPGFDALVRIHYENNGTTILDGEITFTYDNTKMDFLNSSLNVVNQTSNMLSFEAVTLLPLGSGFIDVSFNILPPPTNIIGDLTSFTSSITPVVNDTTPNDNIHIANNIIIGPYDPNDITVFEGEHVNITEKEEYLHYKIRFQNTGNYPAQNVVVQSFFDDNLDIESLQIIDYSDSVRVQITNTNDVEFIFENIYLPDSVNNEPESHGYIYYKIKPKNTVVLGDSIYATASIYFDFNPAVVTNTVFTTFVDESLSIDNQNQMFDVVVYPNPTKNILMIQSSTAINQINIYNQLGELVLSKLNTTQIDLSELKPGLYFCNIVDENGNFVTKRVIKN